MSLELNWTTAAAVCGADCDTPPPDSILLIPPPPLPSFLQMAPLQLLQANLSDEDMREEEQIVPPCGPRCDWSAAPGVEFVELPRQGSAALDDAWFLILVGSSVAVLLLGALLAFVLMKCRQGQSHKSQVDNNGARCRAKFRHAKPVTANLPPPLGTGLGTGLAVGPCCAPGHNPHLLWAAITHKGTPAHFAVPGVKTPHAEYYRPPPGLGYYGALDPRFPTSPPPVKSEPGTPDSQIYSEIPEIKLTEKLISFDNTAFEDYMYDPTEAFPLAEVTPPTLRRGQTSTLTRLQGRPFVGPPTNIESPNLPPLNLRGRNPLLV